jgi:hypothetical protein
MRWTRDCASVLFEHHWPAPVMRNVAPNAMPPHSHNKPKSTVPKRRGTVVPNVVPHPRYGDCIVPSGVIVPTWEILSFWGYKRETIFPESAIPADVTRQSFTVLPRRFYVDVLKQCRTCKRPFIFFAREQQHWYEELGFNIDADCVLCAECRKSDQQLRRRFMRYSQVVSRTDLDDKELGTLVEDAVFLFDAGVLHDEQKLRRFRNLARRRIPGSTAAASIDRVIAALESRDDETD